MVNKPKICDVGKNKASGFKGCGKSTYKLTYGICDSCLYSFFTTTEVGKILFEKRKIQIKSSNWRIEKKELKEKLKTLSDYKNDLQKEINTIVRLIDNGHPCIATKSFGGKMNAGHYISIGSNSTIRFHLENIWLQSEHSNMWKSGDTLRYQEGIVELFGKDYLDHLNSLKMIPAIKLSINDLKEKILICRIFVKELKNCNKIFSNMDRISIRKELNAKIGIYK
jgi:hypothetical protein